MHCRNFLALAAALLALPASSLAYYQARTYTIGAPTADMVVDSQTGRAFIINVLRDDPATPAMVNVTDLWRNSGESGWGVYLEQQGTTLFGAMFLQGADGAPAWYVMSEGKRRGDGSFHGQVFRTGGPLTAAGATLTAVGTLTFTPQTQDQGWLSYDIGDAKRSVAVSRQAFAADRSCGWKVAIAGRPAGNYTSLWFDPARPGWGIATTAASRARFTGAPARPSPPSARWRSHFRRQTRVA